jgi:amino acid transporter
LTGSGAATLVDPKALINPEEFGKPEVGLSAILSGASVLALCYLGFDAVTTISEEAINPEKNIGRAILIVCLGAGLAFIALAYIFQLAWPTGWMEFESADTASVELIGLVAGSTMAYLFTAVYCVGCFASALAAQASGARILFSMGRDGVLYKKFFGHISDKFKTPTYNIILVGAIGLVSIFMDLLSAATIINFGALTGFILVNVSVIAHYFVRLKRRTGMEILKYLIMPIIGAAVCFAIWINLDHVAMTVGIVWTGVGLVYMVIITRFFRKPLVEMSFDESAE